MTDVMIVEVDTDAVAKREPARPAVDGVDSDLVDQLVEQARTAGLQLTGDGGLLQQLTKRVLESVLDGEIIDHLGRALADAVRPGRTGLRCGRTPSRTRPPTRGRLRCRQRSPHDLSFVLTDGA
jgi:hypothetical protein